MADIAPIPPRVGPVQPDPAERRAQRGGTPSSGAPFDTVLREQLLQQAPPAEAAPSEPLRFSAHAQQRLQQRDITLGAGDMAKISQAVDKAQEKGSKESLILLDDMAFVVSVKNRVVITAVDQPSMKQSVFTNIDSVVMA
ncbi:MAG: TIGR02530 family flagellar biosynthesis protein [Chloroflexota bacterium]